MTTETSQSNEPTWTSLDNDDPVVVERVKLRSLRKEIFDASFRNFVTPRVARFLYRLFLVLAILALIGAMGGGIAMLVNADDSGQTIAGFSLLVGGPLAVILVLLLIRLAFEFFLVLFRMADHLKEIDRKTRREGL